MTEDIGFKVFAAIDGLKESMQQASLSVTKFTAESKEQIVGLKESFETLNRVMLGFTALLAGGFIFKEMIEGTEKWTDSIRSLSHQFGISTEEASGLAVALTNIGSSTDQYAGAAAKLDRQVKSNEDKINELGVVTRGTNGDLLSQQQIMLNAISTLGTYKEGTDRNIASQFLFGRGAGDLQKLLRLTNEEIRKGAEDAERFGLVVTGEAADGGRAFQRSIAQLDLSLKGLEYSMSERIIPALTKMAEVFTKTVVPAVNEAISAIARFENRFGEAIAIALAHNDKDLIAAIRDEANGVPYGKKQEEKPYKPSGTQTVPEGFGDKSKKDEALKQEIALAQLEVATKEQLGKIELQNKKNVLAAGVAAGTISKQEELQQLRDLADQEFQIDQKALQEESKIDGLSVVEKKKVYDQLLILKAKHEQEINKINLQAAQIQAQQAKQIADTISKSFDQMLSGVLQGTQTWQQAMSRMFSNLVLAIIEGQAKLAFDWVAKEALKTTATVTGDQLRSASNAAASATGLAAQAVGAQKSVGMSAGQAAASVYADVAAIPYIGWLLAPPAAAAAFVAVEAFGAGFSAQGGFDIPTGVNPVTQLHQREMVLPADLADKVRGMTGGSGAGGGDTHLHVHAVDANSVRRLFMDSGDHLAASLKRQLRNANPNLANFKV